jgi:hypothetical protein
VRQVSGLETDLEASNRAAQPTLLLAQSSVQGNVGWEMPRASSTGNEFQIRRYFVLSHHVQPAPRAAFLEDRTHVEFRRAFASGRA